MMNTSKVSERKLNEFGFYYYDELPENARPGSMFDFVENGRKKVGMEYLVYSEVKDQYHVQVLRQGTPGVKIKKYIDDGRLFIITKTQ